MKDYDANFADRVCELYNECGSVKMCSKELRCSWQRIIKILSTRGYVLNDNHGIILKLREEGESLEYISEQTGLSVKTIQAYLPAKRPLYGIGQSENAMKIKNWRAKKAEGSEKRPHTDSQNGK